MNYIPPKNTVAVILHGYAWLNAIAGCIGAIIMAFNDVSGMIITVELAAILVASFLIYALGEIIALLHDIKLNTARTADPIPDELPDL
jgi:hypothetical protein